MGEVKAATTVTSWWVGVMLKQLWWSAPWGRVQCLLHALAIFGCAVRHTVRGLTQALFLTFLVSVYITQSAAMRLCYKKTGKPPRPKTGGPVRGWWTPYIYAYDRLTNLIKMSEDIRTGLKGIFGQKSSREKESRKN
eukprot:7396466-Ditylum_brightwellii.AAC.1